eukprot:1189756-Prorocentrum_minimum.AAC.3
MLQRSWRRNYSTSCQSELSVQAGFPGCCTLGAMQTKAGGTARCYLRGLRPALGRKCSSRAESGLGRPSEAS